VTVFSGSFSRTTLGVLSRGEKFEEKLNDWVQFIKGLLRAEMSTGMGRPASRVESKILDLCWSAVKMYALIVIQTCPC